MDCSFNGNTVSSYGFVVDTAIGVYAVDARKGKTDENRYSNYNDFENKHVSIDRPIEIHLIGVYQNMPMAELKLYSMYSMLMTAGAKDVVLQKNILEFDEFEAIVETAECDFDIKDIVVVKLKIKLSKVDDSD